MVLKNPAGQYSLVPQGYDEVAMDTKIVARQILKQLIESGIDPIKNQVFISIRGVKAVKGETGKDLVEYFGVTYYNYNDDRLSFEKP